MNSLLFAFAILNGFFVGVVGAERQWSMIRTILTSFFSTFFGIFLIVALAGSLSHADESSAAFNILRQTTVEVNGTECLGSGSVVEGKSGHHYLITNAHVCGCAKWKGEIHTTREGGELVSGKVVKQDWDVDLCAARIDDNTRALKLAPRLLPMTEINTRGYPTGRLTESHGRSYTDTEWGIFMPIYELGACPPASQKVYGYDGQLKGCGFTFTSTLTDLYSRPGSSGSPVVNDNGELVGVISSWHPDNDHDAGMVTFRQLKRFLSDL